MSIFVKENFAEKIVSFSQIVLTNGSWLFPVGLLLITFLFKCFVCKTYSHLALYKSITVLPIEIKSVACSFIFASAVLQPALAVGLFFIGLVALLLLGVSIGAYNQFKVENISVFNDKKANIYLVIAFITSAFMLKFSILIIQVSETL